MRTHRYMAATEGLLYDQTEKHVGNVAKQGQPHRTQRIPGYDHADDGTEPWTHPAKIQYGELDDGRERMKGEKETEEAG